MTDERCPCGCGLKTGDAQRGFYEGSDFANLHIAWHRLMRTLRDAALRDLDRLLRRLGL